MKIKPPVEGSRLASFVTQTLTSRKVRMNFYATQITFTTASLSYL